MLVDGPLKGRDDTPQGELILCHMEGGHTRTEWRFEVETKGLAT